MWPLVSRTGHPEAAKWAPLSMLYGGSGRHAAGDPRSRRGLVRKLDARPAAYGVRTRVRRGAEDVLGGSYGVETAGRRAVDGGRYQVDGVGRTTAAGVRTDVVRV